MTRRLLEITSVTAHTECGPTGERSDMPLPLDAAELRKTGNLIEIAVHAHRKIASLLGIVLWLFSCKSPSTGVSGHNAITQTEG